jgi:hypothetical protein
VPFGLATFPAIFEEPEMKTLFELSEELKLGAQHSSSGNDWLLEVKFVSIRVLELT